MALPRFIVPELFAHQSLDLPAHEAHHASRVLRCSVGDQIVLFDGQGNEAPAEIAFADKRSVRVQVGPITFAPKDHADQLHLAVALPKGDRQRSVIEKLIELGVDALVPLDCTRSVAVIDQDNSERLDRFAVEACKQSGRNRMMQIQHPQTLKELLASGPSANVWVLHPKGRQHSFWTIPEATQLAPNAEFPRFVFCIGPEGGSTDEEIDMAVQAGAKLLTLGERILRVETAVCTASILGSLWLQLRESTMNLS